MEDVETREIIVTREVKETLNETELAELGAELAAAEDRLAKKKAEKKKEDAVLNQSIKDIQGEVTGYADQINTGEVDVTVECAMRFDDTHNKVSVVRLDNDEVLEERAMTAEESQREMFGGDEAGEGADERRENPEEVAAAAAVNGSEVQPSQ